MPKEMMILAILKMLWQGFLKEAAKEQVKKTDNDYDDSIVNVVDVLFGQ